MSSGKITRVRTGCWTCRKRGYRCDEAKPVCNACTRLNIECQGYGLRLTWMQTPARSKHPKASRCKKNESTAMVIVNLSLRSKSIKQSPGKQVCSIPATPSSLLSSKDQFLLQHYFWTVSALLSTTHDRSINTYCRIILPMAYSCDMLLNTLLLVSTTHLACRYEQFAVELPHYRNRVLPSLISRIEAWDGFDVSVLATVIMLSINEIFEANAKNWFDHLQAAGKIITDYMAQCKEPDHPTKMLLDIFAYHNVLACVGTNHPSLFTDYYTSDTWSALTGHSNAFLASVDRLLSLVAKLSMLSSQPDPTPSTSPNNQPRTISATHAAAASKLKTELETWRPPPGITEDASNTAEAMRYAGLLFFYKLTAPTSSAPLDVAGIQNSCKQIIRHIHYVPVESPANASHLWPLYMAGSFLNTGAVDLEGQKFVRARLAAMKSKRGVKTVDLVRERLDQMWISDGIEGSVDIAAPLILV